MCSVIKINDLRTPTAGQGIRAVGVQGLTYLEREAAIKGKDEWPGVADAVDVYG